MVQDNFLSFILRRAFLLLAVGFFLSLGACQRQPPKHSGPVSPTGAQERSLQQGAVSPGPDGWWLVAQRLPQSDFGLGFTYFLMPADTRRSTMPGTTDGLMPVPALCPSPRGIRLIRLAPVGGRIAIFCWLTDDGSVADDRFWVWDPSSSTMSPVTLTGSFPLTESGEELRLLLENPLWSIDGKAIFALATGGYLAVVDVPQGRVEILHPISGEPLALDPQQRYLAESILDASFPASDGSPKRYEISHLYFLNLATGDEERWMIPKAAQKILPSGEACWVEDNENSVGWEPQSGGKFLFIVACGSRMDWKSVKQYVFVTEQKTQDSPRLLWQTSQPAYIHPLWAPHGQQILLQVAYLNAESGTYDGETLLLDLQGQVIKRWENFPTSVLEIVGWSAP